MNARAATLGLVLTTGLVAQATLLCAASTIGSSGRFILSATVPHAGGSLPLYRLSRTQAPSDFVAGALDASGAPALGLEGQRFVSRDAQGIVHAYSDPVRGEAQIFPDLTLRGQSANPTIVNSTAQAVFARNDIIPKDATTVRLGAETTVSSVDAVAPGTGEAKSNGRPGVLFTYVSVLRYAAGLQVYGIGSKATVGIGPDGSIRALTRRWESAGVAGSIAPTTSPAQVVATIRTQTASYLAQGATVNVEHIERAYYDGDARYLQPIYFYMAGIHEAGGINETVVGYVPYGAQAEPIVSLDGSGLQALPSPFGSGGGMQSDSSQITLGEYANDDGQTVDQGNALLTGLQTYGGGIYGPKINRTQYLWSAPAAYIGSSAQSYVDSVQVAHTPPHGDWDINTTSGTGGGAFFIFNIGTGGNPGYGSASGGKLVTWMLDSCEVAPSYYDLQYTTGNGNNAFNYWWPVFQGLHHVLAYRTKMLLHQTGFDQQFGQDAEIGTNIGSAWYNDDASWYSQYSSYTYLDTHLNLNVHYGSVSIFQDTRNLNESIYNVGKQSASSNLKNSWMGN